MERRALITGVGGQDGSYLAELLLDNGYHVVGIDRSERGLEVGNLAHLGRRIELVGGDLRDLSQVAQLLREHRPHEVYHLASASFVPASWEAPLVAATFTPTTTVALLEAIRIVSPLTRLFYAASAEIFGRPAHAPQTEATPLAPLTPYGAAKAHGLFLVQAYRSQYGLHASSGILYNHESPRRSLQFLPRKVAHGVARIKLGLDRFIELGNLDARRDWSFAGDVVRAMHLMVLAEEPRDYVIASGVAHTVEELVAVAFSYVGLDWREHVRVDEALMRGPSGDVQLVGDASRAHRLLGWRTEVDFESLVSVLVEHDLERITARGSGSPAA